MFGTLDSIKNVTWERGRSEALGRDHDVLVELRPLRRSERFGPADVAALRPGGGRVMHLDEPLHESADSLRPRYEALDAYVQKQRGR